jgi:hypothetical protein
MVGEKLNFNEEKIMIIKGTIDNPYQISLIDNFILLNKKLFLDKKNTYLREQLSEICSELDEFLSDKQIEQLIDLAKENAFLELQEQKKEEINQSASSLNSQQINEKFNEIFPGEKIMDLEKEKSKNINKSAGILTSYKKQQLNIAME